MFWGNSRVLFAHCNFARLELESQLVLERAGEVDSANIYLLSKERALGISNGTELLFNTGI